MAEVTVEGVKIAYEERGKGEPLMLLHGWNSSRKQWLHNLKAFAPHFRVLAPDLPGFGESAESDAFPYTLEGLASFTESFRRALHIPPFHLLGHSMGGCIALRYSTLYGDNVRKLVLVSTPTISSSLGLRVILPGAESVVSMTYRFRKESTLKWMFYRGLYRPELQDLDFVRSNVRAAALIPRRVLCETTRLVRRMNLEDDLRETSCPTLIVFGNKDKSVNIKEVERQRRLLPRPYVTVMTYCAHCPPYERPDMFNRLVLDFLSAEDLG